MELRERIEAKVERIPESGCWIWVGSVKRNGYGHMKALHSNGTAPAHRVVYEVYRGPIPRGMDLDHLCRVRCCVNPLHLEPVTRHENLRRAGVIERLQARARAMAEATTCTKGHAMTPENTYVYPSGRHRACRICLRAYRKAA